MFTSFTLNWTWYTIRAGKINLWTIVEEETYVTKSWCWPIPGVKQATFFFLAKTQANVFISYIRHHVHYVCPRSLASILTGTCTNSWTTYTIVTSVYGVVWRGVEKHTQQRVFFIHFTVPGKVRTHVIVLKAFVLTVITVHHLPHHAWDCVRHPGGMIVVAVILRRNMGKKECEEK